MTGDGADYAQLKKTAEGLRQKLLKVNGVTKVNLYGTQAERIFVEFSHAKLATLGITPQALFDSLAKQNNVVPAGTVETSAQRVPLRVTGALDGAKAVAETRAHFAATTIPFTDYFLPLQASGRLFMHTLNHPHIAAIAQLARGVARRLGAEETDLRQPLENIVPDALSLGPIWPVYPGVAESLGLQPSWL
ncbi:hypothetical protein LTR94_031109, partial [Friedmanniomyces endolithicus]